MEKEPQRTIREVIVEGERGNLLRVEDLQAMSPDEWGMLRDSISNRHTGGKGISMLCMKCKHPVYIRAYKYFGRTFPGFVHFDGSPTWCQWYQGKNRTPDSLKAEQYGGQQESPAHELLCKKIGELAALDKRYIRHTINKYHNPQYCDNARRPDVYIEWEGHRPFAIELQLSNTYQTEISGRCTYYSKEGIPLIWVLYAIHEYVSIPQSIKDVVRRHRNNAFVIDRDSIRESYSKNTLVFKRYLLTGDYFDFPELVTIDSLTVPENQTLPYHEDHLAPALRAKIDDRRKPFFHFFNEWGKKSTPPEDIKRILNTLPEHVPEDFIFMIAAAFSIVATLSAGRDINYASNDPNVRAMLNSYFNGNRLARYADMMEFILGRIRPKSSTSPNITTHAVRKNITLRKSDTEQAGIETNEWRAMEWLLPEVFDECERELLRFTDQLPCWTQY
ncbi:hypothetical protein GGQ74_000948 [Desulfobaculum xiamenense]|uniref:Competence protein CoiA nuclease-like domain-containing protein n=1 Tax=Desulfobaculum xiamenense TaxID=995050 RepID=A0A846QG78_9BACT|nr:hypothetical protein [Desulfobaculum xiamenense]NJB67308.1 hypothetical protein [Desulfobaculum xiamenense]